MRRWVHRNCRVLWYAAFVLFVVGVTQYHANRVDRELRQHDEVSCEQRAILGRNQAHVLHALILDIRLEHLKGGEQHPGAGRTLRVLVADLDALKVALAKDC